MIDAPENPEKTNAKVIIKKNNIIIDSRDIGDNVIKDLLPFSFQFFTRLAAVFAEKVSSQMPYSYSYADFSLPISMPF